MISPPHVMPQPAREIAIDKHALDFRKLARCQLSVDLAEEGVPAPGLQKAWRHEGGGAFPHSGTPRKTQQPFDPVVERCRKSA
jgi:hypothetical protein